MKNLLQNFKFIEGSKNQNELMSDCYVYLGQWEKEVCDNQD